MFKPHEFWCGGKKTFIETATLQHSDIPSPGCINILVDEESDLCAKTCPNCTEFLMSTLVSHTKSFAACSLHQNMDSILWLYAHALYVCVWLLLFFHSYQEVCRFLWVIRRVTSSAWLWLSSRKSFHSSEVSRIFWLCTFFILTTNPPPKSHYLYVFSPDPLFSLSVSLFLSPCLCVVIESSCEEVTIVHRAVFGGGPREL